MSNVPREDLRQVPYRDPTIVGKSKAVKEMLDFAKRVARSNHSLLITGETGVGKDLLVEYIHYLGRKNKALVSIDCGAINQEVVENELFGHEIGSFTDAKALKRGLIEVAEEGTLFFNELGNMSLNLQAKLLRTLESKAFRRVGGTREIPVHTRIIAATNVNLERAVRSGQIRKDLYYRLNVIDFNIAPLREHKEDIEDLAEHFLRSEEESLSKSLTQRSVDRMMLYGWPGNVRELKHVVMKGAFLSGDASNIELGKFGFVRDDNISKKNLIKHNKLHSELNEHEEKLIRDVLIVQRGNIRKAADSLDMHRSMLNYKIKKYNLKDFVNSIREDKFEGV